MLVYDDPAPSSGGNTVVWIVVILVGAFVLIAAICAGGAFLFYRTTQQMVERIEDELAAEQEEAEYSERAARVFLDDLRAGKPEAALQSATPAFQKQKTIAELKALVAKYAFLRQLKRGERIDLFLVNPGSGEHEYQAFIDLPSGQQAELKMVLRKVGEEWKVDRLVITEGPPIPREP